MREECIGGRHGGYLPCGVLRVTPQNGVESLALTTIAKQLINRLDMIAQTSRHCRRPG
jgi:hypothetical protein